MYDIQLIRLLDVLDVDRIEEAVGVPMRSIIIHGRDFRNVETVLINGAPSPEFVQYTANRIVAQVPSEQVDAIITEVFVLSTELTFTERSMVEFTVGVRPKKVSGTLRLMQTFIRMLLRTPRSNVFARDSGGGLLKRIGTNIAAPQRDRVGAEIAVSVAQTRQYLIRLQTAERAIPANERLLNAEIIGLTVDPANTSIFLTILLTTHAGTRVASTLLA